MTFPTVNGSNLLREKLTLPRDFQGRLNLIFIPFEQWQQMEVDFLDGSGQGIGGTVRRSG